MAIPFKRNLSPFLQDFFTSRAAVNARTYNIQVAATFTLRSGTVLYYATANLTINTVSVDGASLGIAPLTFSGRLSAAPDIKYSSSAAPDAGEFKVINLDYLITSAVPSSGRIYDDCKVRIYLAFPKPDGNYEGLIYFDGLLTEVSGDDEDGNMRVVHELSSQASTVGTQISQRCVNELGDSWCGVPSSTLPGGAECSKEWEDEVAGCAYWGGVYNGVPFIGSTSFGAYTGGSTGDDPGFPDDPPPPGRDYDCPCAETSLFPSPNGGIIHARDMKYGEAIYAPGDDDGDDIVLVEHVEVVRARYRYRIETRYGAALIASATHKLLRGLDDMKGIACTAWKFDQYGVLCKIPSGVGVAQPVKDVEAGNFNYSFQPLGPGPVLKLTVGGSRRYWAGMEPDYYIGNHNRKVDFYF